MTTAAPEDEDVTAIGIMLQHLLDLQCQAVHATAHVGVAGRQPDPRAGRQRDHRRRRRFFITAPSAAVTAAGSTAPSILTRTPPASVISIRPVSGRAAAGGRPRSAARRRHRGHLDRHQPWPMPVTPVGQIAPPFEELVGVELVPPRHDRNRGAGLERRRHELTLKLRRPTTPFTTRLLSVRLSRSGHLAAPRSPLQRSLPKDPPQRKTVLTWRSRQLSPSRLPCTKKCGWPCWLTRRRAGQELRDARSDTRSTSEPPATAPSSP